MQQIALKKFLILRLRDFFGYTLSVSVLRFEESLRESLSDVISLFSYSRLPDCVRLSLDAIRIIISQPLRFNILYIL